MQPLHAESCTYFQRVEAVHCLNVRADQEVVTLGAEML